MMRADVAEFKCGRLAQVRVIVGEVDDKLNSKAYIVSKPMLCLCTFFKTHPSLSRVRLLSFSHATLTHARLLELTELPRVSQVHASQNIP
jgi:hypothetical protein